MGESRLVLDFAALEVWLNQHPITLHQQTDVVLVHLLVPIVKHLTSPVLVVKEASNG
jgi:hypothetical protein